MENNIQTKEAIETILGYEINKFKIEIHYKENEHVEILIKAVPKTAIQFIDIPITISKTLD